jgi:CheY-like chemotaxis protein
MVDQILDIVDEAVAVRQSTNRLGLLGSAVVGKEVTDFLDLRAVVEAVAPEWLGRQDASRAAAVVLLAEGSTFLRGLIRGELEMAGHRVLEACDATEAINRMEGVPITAVLAGSNLPPGGYGGLQDAIRQRPNLAQIPVVELAASAGQREEMLTSIAQLASAVATRDPVIPAGCVKDAE